jgi:LysR family transcriptional regulator for bpeEF and oprC
MDRLQAMKLFTRVAETGSFSRAADSLGMPRASATIVIQQLEAHLKIKLLHRTTRRLSLTEDGDAYYQRVARILTDIEETESGFATNHQAPRGRLRIDMPVALGRSMIMPALYDFHALYPDIDLMVGMSDRQVDLLHDSVDCVIRIGDLSDSTLVARRIGYHRQITVASPAYLAQHGTPQTIEDLERHATVHYFWARNGRPMDITFVVEGKTVSAKMRARFAVNDVETFVESALRGLSIVQAPDFLARPHLESGALVEVLAQWQPTPMPISVVYPHSRHLSPAVRVFVDWVAELFENSPLMR